MKQLGGETDAKYIERLERAIAIIKSKNRWLDAKLAKYEADPDGSKAHERADSLSDALLAELQDTYDKAQKRTGRASAKRTADKNRRTKVGKDVYHKVCHNLGVDQLTTDEQWTKAYNNYEATVAGTPDAKKWKFTTFRRWITKALPP
jgi:hypothetical protein